MGQSTFMYAAAKEWNDLPTDHRNCSSLKIFKTKLFKFFTDLDKTDHKCSVYTLYRFFLMFFLSCNSPVSSSLWPLNKKSEDAFFTALASIWSNIFTNSNVKETCLLLCLLCLFKFQTLTCRNFWIFYFISRLTLYKCVVNVCVQR